MSDNSDQLTAPSLRAEAERYRRLARGLSRSSDQDLLIRRARELDDEADALERAAAAPPPARTIIQMQQQPQQQQQQETDPQATDSKDEDHKS